jgi:phage shock protein E
MNLLKKIFKRTSLDEQLASWITAGATLIDVRTFNEYKEYKVNGSINLPLDTLFSKINLLKKDDKIIVFCRTGNRSRHAKQLLEQQGFKNVLDGQTWEKIKQIQEK